MSYKTMTDEDILKSYDMAKEEAHNAPRAMSDGVITGDTWARKGQVCVDIWREIRSRVLK